MSGYTITETARQTGMSVNQINKLIFEKKINLENKMIPEQVVHEIKQEKLKYVSLLEIASLHDGERFRAKASTERKKLLNYLEKNNCFDLHVLDYGELLSGTERDVVFFERKNLRILEENLREFFGECNLDEHEKILQLIRLTPGHKVSKRYIQQYMDEMMFEKKITPVFTDCVRRILACPDLPDITDEHIGQVLDSQMSVGTKDYLISVLNYCRKRLPVLYSEMIRNRPETISIPAYSDQTYISIAKCVFNAEYIAEHQMIEKALNNHVFAETWLYISLFFACGWRAEDICRGWRYLNLKNKADGTYGICKATLYEDILEDKIPEQVYVDVCEYAVAAIDLSGQRPQKTSMYETTSLKVVITPELMTFYGMLTLIAEAVMLRKGDGYMQPNRAPTYQNRMTLRNFFGEEMDKILHGRNLQSRRLNKDYLQGVEDTARRTGCGGLMASAVASYARNHTNLDTIRHYLQDHALHGENVEMVIYFMMEREVLSFEGYQTLAMAYPDSFQKLPMRKQNQLLLQLNTSAYEIELIGSGVLAAECIKESFVHGDADNVLIMLKSMFEITQNRGQAKDPGVYCIRRALGKACKYPEYRQCIPNACDEIVFCKYGYIPLLKVIKEYIRKAKIDRKADGILKQVIIPRYQQIINKLMRDMNMDQNERLQMKEIMQEVLNE